jgi:hypothetical protein
MQQVERVFRQLVTVLSDIDPARLRAPMEISEIYQNLVPYRRYRTILGFETSEDYEMTLLRFFAGEGGFASVDPPEIQDSLIEEAGSINPNPAAFREYAAAQVYLNTAAVKTALQGPEAYAPPGPAQETSRNSYAPTAPPPAETRPSYAPEPHPIPSPLTSAPGYERDREPSPASLGCPHCGSPSPRGRVVRFCPFCGRSAETIACPACHTELDPGWYFCIACGHRIASE